VSVVVEFAERITQNPTFTPAYIAPDHRARPVEHPSPGIERTGQVRARKLGHVVRGLDGPRELSTVLQRDAQVRFSDTVP
jgi:hypothetical protein